MSHLKKRIQRLESACGSTEPTYFLWLAGVPLADALADRGFTVDDLSREDQPFRAIEIVFVEPGPDGPVQIPDPIHERDRPLLDLAA